MLSVDHAAYASSPPTTRAGRREGLGSLAAWVKTAWAGWRRRGGANGASAKLEQQAGDNFEGGGNPAGAIAPPDGGDAIAPADGNSLALIVSLVERCDDPAALGRWAQVSVAWRACIDLRAWVCTLRAPLASRTLGDGALGEVFSDSSRERTMSVLRQCRGTTAEEFFYRPASSEVVWRARNSISLHTLSFECGARVVLLRTSSHCLPGKRSHGEALTVAMVRGSALLELAHFELDNGAGLNRAGLQDLAAKLGEGHSRGHAWLLGLLVYAALWRSLEPAALGRWVRHVLAADDGGTDILSMPAPFTMYGMGAWSPDTELMSDLYIAAATTAQLQALGRCEPHERAQGERSLWQLLGAQPATPSAASLAEESAAAGLPLLDALSLEPPLSLARLTAALHANGFAVAALAQPERFNICAELVSALLRVMDSAPLTVESRSPAGLTQQQTMMLLVQMAAAAEGDGGLGGAPDAGFVPGPELHEETLEQLQRLAEAAMAQAAAQNAAAQQR